jgi:hypothetical protein
MPARCLSIRDPPPYPLIFNFWRLIWRMDDFFQANWSNFPKFASLSPAMGMVPRSHDRFLEKVKNFK